MSLDQKFQFSLRTEACDRFVSVTGEQIARRIASLGTPFFIDVTVAREGDVRRLKLKFDKPKNLVGFTVIMPNTPQAPKEISGLKRADLKRFIRASAIEILNRTAKSLIHVSQG